MSPVIVIFQKKEPFFVYGASKITIDPEYQNLVNFVIEK